MRLADTDLDEFLRRLSVALAAGGTMPILTLTNDPTVTPTLAGLGQLGLWNGQLFMHVTDANDIQWVNITTRAEPVTAAPTVAPGLDRPVGSVAVLRSPGDLGGGYWWLKLGSGVTEWIDFHQLFLAVGGGNGQLLSDLLGIRGTLVRRFEATLNFGDFSDAGTVKTVRIAPDLPTGAIIVAANAAPTVIFDAPGLASLTLEFDDDTNGTAQVLVPMDGMVGALPAGKNIGNAANGRAIQYFTCTARATGANLDALTAGQVHFEAMYVVP